VTKTAAELPGGLAPINVTKTPLHKLQDVLKSVAELRDELATINVAKTAAPLLDELSNAPVLRPVATLPKVALIPGVPKIPLLPHLPSLQDVMQNVGGLGDKLAPVNVASMFEASPAYLPAAPTIKSPPKPLPHALDQQSVPGKALGDHALVLPHDAIPGAMILEMLIHGLLGDILWNALPTDVQYFMTPRRLSSANCYTWCPALFAFGRFTGTSS
jgi:hypothetical protein